MLQKAQEAFISEKKRNAVPLLLEATIRADIARLL
jgi:hypothetical protein